MSREYGHGSHETEVGQNEREWRNLTFELLRRAGEQGDTTRLLAIKDTLVKVNQELI